MGLENILAGQSSFSQLESKLKELEREKDRLLRIFNGAPSGIFQATPQGKLLLINPSLVEVCGFVDQESMYQKVQNFWRDLFSDPSSEAHLLECLKQDGAVHEFETHFWHCGDEKVDVSLDLRLCQDPKGEYLECFVRDISKRVRVEKQLLKAKEEAESASRTKSNFMAIMSHELRTPLNGLLGMASLLSLEELTPTQKHYLDVIDSSGNALLKLLADILDINRIESGHLDLKNRRFDLNKMILGLGQLFMASAGAKGLKMDVIIDESLKRFYIGDVGRLNQIFSNLMGNAIKYTEKGKIEFSIRETTARMVEFKVKDTGIGIETELKENVFNLFTQVDDSSTRKYGGIGLGLSIVHRLTKLMGGEISLASFPGKGSLFTINLPLIGIPEKGVKKGLIKPEIADIAWRSAPTVLVVEDDPTNQLVTSEILKALACKVDLAKNGQEAFERVQLCHYDLVLMDCLMPVVDGYDATLKIRRWEESNREKHRNIIIALTAKTMKGDREKCFEYGMDDYLSKPVKIETLTEMLTKHLQPEQQDLDDSSLTFQI